MAKTIWLRDETKPMEARSALTPEHAHQLIKHGFRVAVERSTQRAIANDGFAAAGCEMVDSGSWNLAPEQAFILGIKDLPMSDEPLRHRHIYFGHAYKEQKGWRHLLKRFTQGGGTLLDLEYLVDDAGRRVVAFGYWAGFTGCAVGLKAWAGQQLGQSPILTELKPYQSKDELIKELNLDLKKALGIAGRRPTVIIVGAKGRVGTGAGDMADALGIPVTRWDIEETAAGGPFQEILRHDLFVNCVLVDKKIQPFVTLESLSKPDRRLSVISDVSCDPGEYNPIPIYSEPTSFSSPSVRIIDQPPLDLIAIDHLPALLPRESSKDFADQLLPHLLTLNGLTGVWQRALDVFHKKTRRL